MNHEICYYAPEIESVSKRKHLLFIEKAGYPVCKIKDLSTLETVCTTRSIMAIITTEEGVVKTLTTLFPAIPIVAILKASVDFNSLMRQHDKGNIFFRSEEDPIDSVLETVYLIQRLSEKTHSKASQSHV